MAGTKIHKCKGMGRITLTPTAGGHDLQPTTICGKRSGWRCTVCKATTSDKAKLSHLKCRGAEAAAAGEGKRHDIVMSGAITWSHTCGAYADAKAKGFNFVRKGPPSKLPQGGGPYGQM